MPDLKISTPVIKDNCYDVMIIILNSGIKVVYSKMFWGAKQSFLFISFHKDYLTVQ